MFKQFALSWMALAGTIAAGCSVTHEQVWKCIVGDKCIDSVGLHRLSRHKSSTLKRPYIMAVEGGHYHRLFDDCDSNKDGCIDLNDAMTSPQCTRSCMWMKTMHDLTC